LFKDAKIRKKENHPSRKQEIGTTIFYKFAPLQQEIQ
jgi:hypothetical protein